MMSITIRNLENDHRKIVSSLGYFCVLEYLRDPSVAPDNAMEHYFMSQMGVRKRQLVCNLTGENSVVMQAGAMQWMTGKVEVTTGLKGVGDLVGKYFKGKVTKESAIKPEYVGRGTVVLEPTDKYIILLDVADWGARGITIEDGMFLACDGTVKTRIAARTNLQTAIVGKEGLFNLSLQGEGIVALESNIPLSEAVIIDLNNDVLKVDGSYAICWSTGLEFTVEKSAKSIAGSVLNSEGLVNVYRGTGRIMLSPLTEKTKTLKATTHDE